MIKQSPFKWRHFEAEIILLCVRWYLRYALNSRDLEEIMVERGLSVDHTTIYCIHVVPRLPGCPTFEWMRILRETRSVQAVVLFLHMGHDVPERLQRRGMKSIHQPLHPQNTHRPQTGNVTFSGIAADTTTFSGIAACFTPLSLGLLPASTLTACQFLWDPTRYKRHDQ
jgi:hypothetical protein